MLRRSIIAAALSLGLSASVATAQSEYNRYVAASEITYEPAADGTGWLISGAVGFEAAEGFEIGDLSCIVTLALNGTPVPPSDGEPVSRIIFGEGIPTGPFTPYNCALFCATNCPPPPQGLYCTNASFNMCICVAQGSDIPYGPGFHTTGVVDQLVDGDVISITIAAAPFPETLPELDISDDTASITIGAPPPCPADWDNSGAVTSADITSFLSDWFTDLPAGTAIADFDHSGATTSADITAFLAAWFAALQGGC